MVHGCLGFHIGWYTFLLLSNLLESVHWSLFLLSRFLSSTLLLYLRGNLGSDETIKKSRCRDQEENRAGMKASRTKMTGHGYATN